MLTFKTESRDAFALVSFEIVGGVADPAGLAGVELPAGLDRQKGLVIGGRGPVWLYAHLTHLAHPHRWVAVQDPRLGAVVVQCHHPEAPTVGQVLPL